MSWRSIDYIGIHVWFHIWLWSPPTTRKEFKYLIKEREFFNATAFASPGNSFALELWLPFGKLIFGWRNKLRVRIPIKCYRLLKLKRRNRLWWIF